MYINTDIFKIETNHIVPTQGKILISEPFLCDHMFGRSVILLVDHAQDGTMGLILNKPLPLFLNDLLSEIDCRENIPIYKGGPISTDTLFYLHTLENIADSFPVANGIYLNGDFAAIRQFMAEGNSIKGKIRFFLGYSGWEPGQLKQEIEENTWLVDNADFPHSWTKNPKKIRGRMHLAILAENMKCGHVFHKYPLLTDGNQASSPATLYPTHSSQDGYAASR